jgi:5-methylcytosine-specific restriction endonuclease McrBC regulatory subunit McrC
MTSSGWEVRVNDAVGIIRVGERLITVLPKIPTPHLLTLLEHANLIPRMSSAPVGMASGQSLWDLLARWAIACTEAVLRRDLIRDYRPATGDLGHIRGHVDVKQSTLAVLRGRLSFTCDYDTMDQDNALNRVLLAAMRCVAQSPATAPTTKAHARRVASRFENVSELLHSDITVTTEPRTSYYRDALGLAKTILTATARGLQVGDLPAWAFLIRTPEAVEDGVRNILRVRLKPDHVVSKQGLQLKGSSKTLNPDLVFDRGRALGDVKYKLQTSDWNNADLYQVVTFATGYRTRHAAVFSFSRGRPVPYSLDVGDTHVTTICWSTDPSHSPESAAAEFVDSVRTWLTSAKN